MVRRPTHPASLCYGNFRIPVEHLAAQPPVSCRSDPVLFSSVRRLWKIPRSSGGCYSEHIASEGSTARPVYQKPHLKPESHFLSRTPKDSDRRTGATRAGRSEAEASTRSDRPLNGSLLRLVRLVSDFPSGAPGCLPVQGQRRCSRAILLQFLLWTIRSRAVVRSTR